MNEGFLCISVKKQASWRWQVHTTYSAHRPHSLFGLWQVAESYMASIKLSFKLWVPHVVAMPMWHLPALACREDSSLFLIQLPIDHSLLTMDHTRFDAIWISRSRPKLAESNFFQGKHAKLAAKRAVPMIVISICQTQKDFPWNTKHNREKHFHG